MSNNVKCELMCTGKGSSSDDDGEHAYVKTDSSTDCVLDFVGR